MTNTSYPTSVPPGRDGPAAAGAGEWVAVRDDDHDTGFSYAAAAVQAGPFPSLEDVRDWIGDDERFIAVRRRSAA